MPAVKRAGLEPLTFHGLRHTYAGLLIATGAHAKAIQQRMGHSSFQVTFDVYGHVLPDIDEHITTALDALLRAAPAEKPRGWRGVGPKSGSASESRETEKGPLTWEDASGRAQTRTADLYGVNVAL